jgi:PAS domain S-box-containing protein
LFAHCNDEGTVSAQKHTRRLILVYLLVAVTAAGSVVGLAWWVGQRIPAVEANRLANIQLRLLRRAKEHVENFREDLEYRAQVLVHRDGIRGLSRQLTAEIHEDLTQGLFGFDLDVIQIRRYDPTGEELWERAAPGQRVPRLSDGERAELFAWARLRDNANTTWVDLHESPVGHGRWLMRAVAPVWSSDDTSAEFRGIVCLWAANRDLFEQFLITVHPFPESYTFVVYWKIGEESSQALPVIQWHYAEPQWAGAQAGDAAAFLTAIRDEIRGFREGLEDWQILDMPRRDGSRQREVISYVPVLFGSRRWVLFLSTPYRVATELSTAQHAFIILMGLLAAAILVVGAALLYYQRRRLVIEATEQSRRQLREMGFHYRELFAENPTAMLVCDDAGKLVDCNYSAERLIGRSRQEVTGRPLSALFESEPIHQFWETLKRQGNLHVRDTRLVRERDHAALLVEVWGRRIGGQWIVMAHDVEERRDLQRQIARLKRIDSVGALASTLAHDFNNMLGQVQILVSHLRAQLSPDQAGQESVAAIEEKVEDAARLVGGLLALREDVVADQPIDLDPVLADFVAHQQQVVPPNVHLALSVRGPIPTTWITPHALRRILGNLCVNACDAMPYGGELTIRASAKRIEERDATDELQADEYVVLSVSDNGTGMSESVLDQLFQPFFTTKNHGTGLGLWTVYKIVRGVGGTIHVHSRLGKGTRFSVYLPHSRPGGSAAAI